MAGGKFKKPQRGGGRQFSRRIETVDSRTSYRERQEVSDDSEEDSNASDATESGSEEESDEEVVVQQPKKKEAAKSTDPGLEVSNPNRAGARNLKASDLSTPTEMSRREREAAEKEAAKAKYWKLHQEGKTDQAKADLARLAVIRKQREEAAAQRLAEQKARDEAAAAKTRK
ncbi:heat- and acid-stable phosphoprotein [Actinomortierella ambigua]|uniref:Heat- and acid-stable phosphoprotein n=1 Tax=Actinomortierella ambigua TaxID=1343610 RepID=A0A9P6PS31_9FUNG|nr:heat- and acid-stable phosphoprotein [Actinomortierella ambigua]KAG0251517.1 heat- and acid-stable phosphoprotein [Actinomortierella ambigua]